MYGLNDILMSRTIFPEVSLKAYMRPVIRVSPWPHVLFFSTFLRSPQLRPICTYLTPPFPFRYYQDQCPWLEVRLSNSCLRPVAFTSAMTSSAPISRVGSCSLLNRPCSSPLLPLPYPYLAHRETTMQRSTQAVAALQAEINRLRHELQTLQVDQKSSDAEDTITVADYLLNRLAENGVTVGLDSLNKPVSFD